MLYSSTNKKYEIHNDRKLFLSQSILYDFKNYNFKCGWNCFSCKIYNKIFIFIFRKKFKQKIEHIHIGIIKII